MDKYKKKALDHKLNVLEGFGYSSKREEIDPEITEIIMLRQLNNVVGWLKGEIKVIRCSNSIGVVGNKIEIEWEGEKLSKCLYSSSER